MNNVKSSFKFCVVLFVMLFVLIIFILYFNNKNANSISYSLSTNVLDIKYNACMNSEVTEEEEELFKEAKEVITNYLSGHFIEVEYYDLTSGFTYEYNSEIGIYGASLIKLVDALYLINKAIDGEIDLDNTYLTYTKNYISSYSEGMATHNIGDKVSLRELIKYAISVSDNSAHLMLLDYIGFDTLKAYGRSLGALHTLDGTDNYGYQSASDTTIYLKEAYRIISLNNEYSTFLKEIMNNDYSNAFNTDTITIYHKYGSWDMWYHDIGLNLDIDHPYAISILTMLGNSNYIEVIQDVHSKIMELHNAFYAYREYKCSLVYE